MFTALIDSMHRKFDKNVHSLNQMKIWENSIRIIDKLLTIAKLVDLSRVFFYYLKVNCFHRYPNPKKKTSIMLMINEFLSTEHTSVHQIISTTWNDHD